MLDYHSFTQTDVHAAMPLYAMCLMFCSTACEEGRGDDVGDEDSVLNEDDDEIW
jgi:hypothetical protein